MNTPDDNRSKQSETTNVNQAIEHAITNMEKYENYKTQFERLKKAMDNEFYMEAIVIEYAIMEDRTAAILSYEGNRVPRNIGVKISDIKKLAQQENSLMKRYFSPDIPNKINLLDEMKEWIDNRTPTIRNSVCRNNIIHHLLEIVLTTDNLKEIAERGNVLCRDLSNRANNYKRMVERHKPKE